MAPKMPLAFFVASQFLHESISTIRVLSSATA